MTSITAKSYITDHLGSVLNTQASAGQKMFGAFGDRFAENYIQEAFAMNANSPAVVYGFAGRELDFESGLSYNRNRMYNPEMGRFTQKDPIGFSGGDENLYRYVGNNPTLEIDPFGFFPISETQGQKIVDEAKTWVRTPYESPGNTKGTDGGADCSGSTSQIYANVSLPYKNEGTAKFKDNSKFSPADGNIPQQGDVGWFQGHVMIYDKNASSGMNVWTTHGTVRNPRLYGPSNDKYMNKTKIPTTWFRYELVGPPVPKI